MSNNPALMEQMRHTIANLHGQLREQQQLLEQASQKILEGEAQLQSKQERFDDLCKTVSELEVCTSELG
jgi:hypothetical protein